MSDTGNVTVALSADEALVLFDLLHRWEDGDSISAPEHPSEQVALANLAALLERELQQPFDPQYKDLVSSARARLAPND